MRCMESIFRQTLPPSQIVVVDDGSTDGTSDWLKKKLPAVELVIQKNQGVSAARNSGIRKATTDWIALLDSDDVWCPTKLEKQFKALKEKPEFKICHTEERWIFKGKERQVASAYKKRGGWIFEACLPVCAISPSTVLIHKSVFEKVGLFDESLEACEDYDFWLRICSRMPVLLIDEPLIEKHGGFDDQLSAQWGLDRWRIQALEKILGEDHLEFKERELVKEQLALKCEVFAKGLQKHGKASEAKSYLSLSSKYSVQI